MSTRTIAFSVFGLALLLTAAAQEVSVKKVPVRYTSAASAREMYMDYCASCHGADGRGHGPAAPALKTAPTDLTTLAARHAGSFPSDHVYAVVVGKEALAAHGTSDMPVWGPIFRQLGKGQPAEEQLRATNLTRYIESLQAK